MSVQLWNFKESTYSKDFKKNPLMTYSSSKSAKIVLSKSIFSVKNQPNFFKNNFHLRISI